MKILFSFEIMLLLLVMVVSVVSVWKIQTNMRRHTVSRSFLSMRHSQSILQPFSLQKNSISLRDAYDKLQDARSLTVRDLYSYIEFLLISIEESKPAVADKLYNRLLEVCLERRLPHYLVTVFQAFLDRNIPYSSGVLTAVTALIAEQGDFSSALEIYDKIISMGVSPTLHNFTPLLRNAGSSTRAKQVLQRMEMCGVESNVITFTTAIKSLESTADWRSGLELLEWMKCLGIEPNEITYCCIITLTSKDQAGDVAINILREMLSNGIPPNQLCYGAALVACVKSYMWDEVDELLKEMADIGLPLLESVLGSVINACRLQQPYVNPKSPQILSWGVDYPNIETNAESLHKLIELQLVKANVEREQQHRGSAQWQKALSLMTTWAKSVENCTDSLYTMTMDVLESYHEYDKMIHVYQMMINASIPISKSSLSFAMRAALNVMDSSFAIKLLEDARREGLDNGYLYNTTMVLCDKCGRHEEATRALLMALTSSNGLSPPPLSSTISSLGSMGRPRLPSVWITRKVISNALDALTRNFSALFTEVVDGKLSPSEKIKPFVRDLTIVLRCTVYEKNLYLSPTSYPMANKLLLDAGDFDTLRVLLNHTLYMSEVNSTRLYDFAAKSLTRIKSIEQGLQVILLLIADLCATGYHRTAVAIFLQGVHRIGSQIVLLLSESSVIQNKGGAILIKTGSLQHTPSTRSLQTGGKNVSVPISSPTTNCRKAFIQRKELSVKLYNYSQILQKYFRDAKFLIGKGNFPSRAYKTTAHIYKNAGMFQFLLDLYYEASIDNAADKQFKNLVVYNLARVPDYWDKAVGILGNMTEKPDLFMYTSGILACETGGDWEHAIYLVDKLKKDGYNITTMAITSAISACAVRGRADEALQLLDDMSAKHRLTPKLCAYNNVLLACAKAGKWQAAYAVYKRICRSSEAYNNLLKCSGELRTDEEMETWTSGGAQSNIFTYHTLIEALGAGEQPLLIDEVYRHAILHGVFRPFETISEGELDLRDHSPHMATAAVRLLLELLLMTPGKVENIGSPKVLADNDMDLVGTLLSALSEQLNTFRSAAGLQSKILVVNGLDLMLITGKGSKLRDTIKALLLKSFRPSMHAYLQKTCPDRIIIPKNSLVEWLKVRGL